MQSNNNVDI